MSRLISSLINNKRVESIISLLGGWDGLGKDNSKYAIIGNQFKSQIH